MTRYEYRIFWYRIFFIFLTAKQKKAHQLPFFGESEVDGLEALPKKGVKSLFLTFAAPQAPSSAGPAEELKSRYAPGKQLGQFTAINKSTLAYRYGANGNLQHFIDANAHSTGFT